MKRLYFYTDFLNSKPQIIGDLIALFAGVPLILATAPLNIFPLALLTPVMLWISLNHISSKRAIWRGWLFGLGLFGTGVHWVYVSLFNYGIHQVIPSLILTFFLVAFLATFTAFWTWIWNKFLSHAYVIIAFPLWWILMEAFRGWFLTGFPWLFLGTTQLGSPLSGYIPIFGVFGVSALSVAISIALGKLLFPTIIKRQDSKSQYKLTPYKINLLGFLILIFAFGLILDRVNWTTPNGKVLDVGMIQPSIPQDKKWDFKNFQNLVDTYIEKSQSLKGTDLIIWPESALPTLASNSYHILDKVMQGQDEKTQLLTGIVSRAPDHNYYNSIIQYPQRNFYRKTHLVPFGEFIPFRKVLKNTLNFLNIPMARFVPADEEQEPFIIASTKVAPLICYEVTYSDYSAKQARNSNWLLTISNDAWFGSSLGPYQHAQIAKFRAAEARLPMVRVTNDGLTFVTDIKGKVIKELDRYAISSLRVEIEAYEGKTPHTMVGDLPAIIVAILGLLFFAWKNPKLKKYTEQN